MRGWKKSFQTNGNDKKAGVTTFISDKIDFKSKVITIDKEGHHITINNSVHQHL